MTPPHWSLVLESGAGGAISRLDGIADIPVAVAVCDRDLRLLACSGPLRAMLPGPAGGGDSLAERLAEAGVSGAARVLVEARTAPRRIRLTGDASTPTHEIHGHDAQDTVWFWLLPVPGDRGSGPIPPEVQSRVAHDLRSPLAVIQSYAGLLATGQPGPLTATQREFLAGIDEKVAEVSRLLDGFLDLGRLTTGCLALRGETIGIGALLHDVADGLAAAARARGAEVVVAVEPADLTLAADPIRLHQVVETLLTTVLTLAGEGATVTLRAGRADGAVTVAAEAPGCDLTDDEAGHALEPFALDLAAADPPGSGLALAVAAGLVALHGGDLAVRRTPDPAIHLVATLPGAGPGNPDAR
jgi:hypothetical protein